MLSSSELSQQTFSVTPKGLMLGLTMLLLNNYSYFHSAQTQKLWKFQNLAKITDYINLYKCIFNKYLINHNSDNKNFYIRIIKHLISLLELVLLYSLFLSFISSFIKGKKILNSYLFLCNFSRCF